MKTLLRFASYLFHAVLVLFLLAVSGLALASGAPSLHLGMLPWTGSTLALVVFCGSLFGLVSLFLAVRGVWRLLFFVWSLAVTVLLIKGYVFTGYRFVAGEARTAAWLTVGSLIALLGAWFQMRRKVGRAERYR